MPFTSETAKKDRGPGWRKTKMPKEIIREDRAATKAASEIVREIIEAHAKDLARHFVRRAKKSDHVLNVAINKLLPEINPLANQRPIAIQVIIENPNGGNTNGTNGATNPTATREGDGRTVLIGS